MTEKEEGIYIRGHRAAYRELLGVALRGLSAGAVPDDLADAHRRIAALESHLADARAQLRMLCDDFGDNGWEDDLHLADVIDKHLGDHLRDNAATRAKTLLDALSDQEFLEAIDGRCLACGQKRLPCYCQRDECTPLGGFSQSKSISRRAPVFSGVQRGSIRQSSRQGGKLKLAPDTQAAIRKSTLAALTKAKGHQGEAATALGIHRRSLQKRLASLFTAAERANMAVQWGWRGTKEKT